MPIGDTLVEESLRRVKLLSETIAWVKTFDRITKEQVLDWIREDQLRQRGVDKDGDVIGYYSRATESITKGRKRFNEHFTLFDTGDFYRSMFITVTSEDLFINATSQSYTDMQKKRWWTDSILGLTDENFEKLKRVVQRSYIKYAKEVLQIA
jgi:hypothetical protein